MAVTCKLYRPQETLEDNCRRFVVKTFPLPLKTHMKREEEKKRRLKEAREAVEKIGKRRVLGHSWLAAKVFGQVYE